MSDKIGVHWFRLDLRLNDNPSLEQLSKEVDSVLPIYIFDENIRDWTSFNVLVRKIFRKT